MYDRLCVVSWSGVHQCLADSSKHWRTMCCSTLEIWIEELRRLSEPNKVNKRVNKRRNEQDSRKSEISNSEL
jgi:hypothetical protein